MYPWSVRWQPIRFEQMATMLITDCVHTTSDCTRASSRWFELNLLRVALAASTPSHLLRTRRRHHDDHWLKQRSKSLEEATFSEQCAKRSVNDDYVRPIRWPWDISWSCSFFDGSLRRSGVKKYLKRSWRSRKTTIQNNLRFVWIFNKKKVNFGVWERIFPKFSRWPPDNFKLA